MTLTVREAMAFRLSETDMAEQGMRVARAYDYVLVAGRNDFVMLASGSVTPAS